jgi:hypothetical protein
MPKGKSAEQYKKESVMNVIVGIIMLAALIAGLCFAFNFLRGTGFLENGM